MSPHLKTCTYCSFTSGIRTTHLQEVKLNVLLSATVRLRKPKKAFLVTRNAKSYELPPRTLAGRINGCMSATSRSQRQQRLNSRGDTATLNWILRLQEWGWQPRVKQLRLMSEELLRKRGDMKPVKIDLSLLSWQESGPSDVAVSHPRFGGCSIQRYLPQISCCGFHL